MGHSGEAWAFWREVLKSPRYVCAPMVNQSDTPFRLLTRKYGCGLCYTPMIHARLFVESKEYQRTFCPKAVSADRPLIAQFCGNDGDILAQAMNKCVGLVDAVDINFGCPQGIAKKGNYGSWLLQDTENVLGIVKDVVTKCKLPVFVKIRILDAGVNATVLLAQQLEALGVFAICVHGRTKKQNKQNVGSVDLTVIKKIKDAVSIPVIANGGVASKIVADQIMENTGADACMSSEALLENPSLFAESFDAFERFAKDPSWRLAMMYQYVELAEDNPPEGFSPLAVYTAHFHHTLYGIFTHFTDLRSFAFKKNEDPKIHLDNVRTTIINFKAELPLWYNRHRTKDDKQIICPAGL